ncbi:IS5 family transposase [Mesorhizobium sp. M7A.F.Ca.US.011.01.1.1]|nr:IS5 family transposase [Mesorhizobium sp. M7A.F.Ca.US.011.01.1.1]
MARSDVRLFGWRKFRAYVEDGRRLAGQILDRCKASPSTWACQGLGKLLLGSGTAWWGAHWRDLSERYGKWKTAHRRSSRWCHAGVWERVFDTLTADRDNKYLMLDSTIVRAHQQAATGKRGAKDQALGRSRGGLTTKIHMLCDTLGRPLRFLITPGQANDITAAPDLLKGQQACAVLADIMTATTYANASPA